MRFRGWLLAVLAVAVALLLAGVVFRQPLGRFIVGRMLAALGRSLKGRVTCDQVTGDVFAHPRVLGLKVVLERDSILVDSIDLSYDLPGMLRSRFSFSSITVWRPRVFATADRPGTAISSTPAEPLEFPRISIGRLRVTDAQFWLDTVLRGDSLDLELALESRPKLLTARLAAVRLRLAREGVTLRDISTGCRVTPESIELTGLRVQTLASSLQGRVAFSVADWGASASLESLSVSLPEFTPMVGKLLFRGEGTVRDTHRTARAAYSAVGLRWRQLALPPVSGRLNLDGSSLRFTSQVSEAGLGLADIDASLDLRSLEFEGQARLEQVAVNRLEPTLPDLSVDATVEFSGRGPDTLRFSVVARSDDLGVDSLVASGRVEGSRLAIPDFRLDGPVGRMRGECVLRSSALDARLELDRMNVAVVSRFLGQPVSGYLDGTLAGHFDEDSVALSGELLTGPVRLPGLEFEVGQARFDLAYGREFSGELLAAVESVRVAGISAAGAQLSLDGAAFDARVDLPDNRLLAVGTALVRREGLELTVDRMEFATHHETLATDRPFSLALRGDTVRVAGFSAAVAGGSISLDLLSSGHGLPDVRLQARDLDLAYAGGLVQLSDSIAGSVDLSISGSETLAVSVTARHVRLPAHGVGLAGVGAELHLARARATIDRAWLVGADSGTSGDTSIITGWFEYDLNDKLDLGDVDISARFRDPGAWVFFFLNPTFAIRSGQVYGDVRLRGNASSPRMSGRVRVSNALLSMPDLAATVERVGAELTFADNRIGLQKIAGRTGKGSVVATGHVDMGSDWQVDSVACDVDLASATLNPQPELLAVVGGRLHIGWSPVRPLSISGDIVAEEGLIAYGFGEPAVPPTSPDTMVLYDVHVRGDRGIWLRNQLADIELAVDLSVRKTRTDVTYSGQLTSRQGSVYYLDHTLRVTRGVISFENISRMNPDLDITARMPVRAAQRDSSGQVPDSIAIAITGTLEHPLIELSSDPAGWGPEEIATYLSFNVTPSDLSALDQRDAVSRMLSERLLGYFQTQVSKRARGFVDLDYLDFESGLLPGTGTKVTVGKYIGRSFYVSYTQNFTGDMQPAVRVEYYLNRRNELVGERSEDGRYSLRYRFRLRY
jgi:autotransporter translocation and assembly factor TamB